MSDKNKLMDLANQVKTKHGYKLSAQIAEIARVMPEPISTRDKCMARVGIGVASFIVIALILSVSTS